MVPRGTPIDLNVSVINNIQLLAIIICYAYEKVFTNAHSLYTSIIL